MIFRDRRLQGPVDDGRSATAPGVPPVDHAAAGAGADHAAAAGAGDGNAAAAGAGDDHAAAGAGDDAPKAAGPVRTAEHALTLLPGMEAVLGSIFRDVDRAERCVDIETYIYRDDRLGRSFADVMGRAAARGVRARLLYDPLGSHETDAPFFDDLRRRGVEVRAYRPIAVALGRGGLLPRDHSRVIVIDDVAYTGGAAWGDEWLPERRGGEGWHDVCLRVEGPCVGDFAYLFEQRWREADGDGDGDGGRLRDYATGRKYPDLELVADTPDDNARVYARYREAIRRARERVWIENAYFFPPSGMLEDLVDAARRGVDVQVILPGATDLPIIQRAARAEHAAWLDRGFKLFEYQRDTMHSKFALVDGDWCTIGTFNANPSSLTAVNEVNLFVFDPAFVARVADLFARDRAGSRPVTRDALAARPLLGKAADWLAHGALSALDALVKHPRTDGRGGGI